MVAVVCAIGDDDVVEKANAHQTAGILNGLCEIVVHSAGFQTA